MRLFIIILVFLLPVLQAHAETKLTLQDCIDQALKNQPTLRAARAGVVAGQGRETQAFSPYLPQITASTGYSDNRQIGGAFGDSTTKSYTSTLSANQMLYDFGKTGNTFDAARYGARSTELDADRVA